MCFLIVLQTRLLIVIVAAYSYSLAVRLTYSSIKYFKLIVSIAYQYSFRTQNRFRKRQARIPWNRLEQFLKVVSRASSISSRKLALRPLIIVSSPVLLLEQVKVSKGSYGFIYISGLEAQNLVNIRVPIRNRCSSDIKGSGIIQRQ